MMTPLKRPVEQDAQPGFINLSDDTDDEGERNAVTVTPPKGTGQI
jgi:hypothetical protein